MSEEVKINIENNLDNLEEAIEIINPDAELPEESYINLDINHDITEEAIEIINPDAELPEESYINLDINHDITEETLEIINPDAELPEESYINLDINHDITEEAIEIINPDAELPEESYINLDINHDITEETLEIINPDAELPQDKYFEELSEFGNENLIEHENNDEILIEPVISDNSQELNEISPILEEVMSSNLIETTDNNFKISNGNSDYEDILTYLNNIEIIDSFDALDFERSEEKPD